MAQEHVEVSPEGLMLLVAAGPALFMDSRDKSFRKAEKQLSQTSEGTGGIMQ